MSGLKRTLCVLSAATILSGASAAQADVIIGNFEQSAPGWGDWSAGVQPFTSIYSYTTDGATLDNYALQITQSGHDQNLAYSAGTAGTLSDFAANDIILFDVTFPETTAEGWAQIYEIAFNSPFGFEGRSYTGEGVGWGPGGGPAQTITLSYDYSNHKASWGGGDPGWAEIIISTNSDASHGVFQIDNVRLVAIPEPTTLGLAGVLGVGGLLRRRR